MECNSKTYQKYNNSVSTMMSIFLPKWSNPLPFKKKKTKSIKLIDSFPSERLWAWKWTLSFRIKMRSLWGENKSLNLKSHLIKCTKPYFWTNHKINSFILENLPSKATTFSICLKTIETLHWVQVKKYSRIVASKKSTWISKTVKLLKLPSKF